MGGCRAVLSFLARLGSQLHFTAAAAATVVVVSIPTESRVTDTTRCSATGNLFSAASSQRERPRFVKLARNMADSGRFFRLGEFARTCTPEDAFFLIMRSEEKLPLSR